MANIGTFTADKDGFTGTLRTLTLNFKVIPNDKTSDHAPDFRIQASNGLEIGAAWKKVSQAERPCVSVSLDDPSFPATVCALMGGAFGASVAGMAYASLGWMDVCVFGEVAAAMTSVLSTRRDG